MLLFAFPAPAGSIISQSLALSFASFVAVLVVDLPWAPWSWTSPTSKISHYMFKDENWKHILFPASFGSFPRKILGSSVMTSASLLP